MGRVTKESILKALEEKRKQKPLTGVEKEMVDNVLEYELVDHERYKVSMYADKEVQNFTIIHMNRNDIRECREIHFPENKKDSLKEYLIEGGFNVQEYDFDKTKTLFTIS